MIIPMASYTQTTVFTCGAAALMGAMASADPNYKPSQIEEMMIWRIANLGFMGDGQAGCGVFGLALAAMMRGYKVDIYARHADGLFANWTRNKNEKQIQTLLDLHDRNLFLEQGGTCHEIDIEIKALIGRLAATHCLIGLITAEDGQAHWVNILKASGENITVFDPWPCCGDRVLPVTAFQYGPHNAAAFFTVSKIEGRSIF